MMRSIYNPHDNHLTATLTDHNMNTDDEDDSCQIMVDSSEIILDTFANLYRNQRMCDVFITVGQKEFATHRLVLSASSDVFHAMLMTPRWNEWHENKIVLTELPECENVFHLFLEYFYTGKIFVTHTTVMPILALADKYIVKSLTRICVKYMCSHIAHAASHNQLYSWLQYSENCGYTNVSSLCRSYIKWNFESVANTSDFSNFELDLLCELLKADDLIVYNEMVLYNCVVRWLDLQKIRLNQLKWPECDIKEQMRNMVDKVMKCIRFPMMTPRELADLLLSPLLKQYSNLLLDRMSLGMLYQKSQNEEIDALSATESGRLLCTPRLYTSDSFNTTLLIENVPNLPSYTVSTFVFSTRMSVAEYNAEKFNEWVVDLYPKGVCFKKCYLIVWQGSLEVPERVKSTIRLSLTCRESHKDIKVRIGIVLYGTQGGVDHIIKVIQRVHEFNSQERILVIDNLIPFDELNPPAEIVTRLMVSGKSLNRSIFLTGSQRDQLKINIIITPIDSS